MKKVKLTKIITGTLIGVLLLALNPTIAHAEWRSDPAGYWFSSGDSYYTAWQIIDGNWYYFYTTGYMAHNVKVGDYYLDDNGKCTTTEPALLYTAIEQQLYDYLKAKTVSIDIDCTPDGVVGLAASKAYNSASEDLTFRKGEGYVFTDVPVVGCRITTGDSGEAHIIINQKYLENSKTQDYEQRVKTILAEIIKDGMTDQEKVKAIHDWIINNTEYDQTYTIYSGYETLVNGKGVCQGYAFLAEQMFWQAGLRAIVIGGSAVNSAGSGSHAWDLVNINGKWRHVDVTWDDPIVNGSTKSMLRYDYFNLTDDEIAKDHTWNTSRYPAAD